MACIETHNRAIGPESIEHGECPLSDKPTAKNQHIHSGRAGEPSDIFALAAVDRKHRFKPEKCSLFTGSLTVRRTPSVRVFSREGDAF